MADIRLTDGNDNYLQPLTEKDQWNNIYGNAGNDTLQAYQGTLIGGKGNDRLERVPIAGEPWRDLQVAYWSAGDNLEVNLAEGWANDGEGGRDTLVGILKVHGSNGKNAKVTGDANDNYYWPNGGTDTFLGGAGFDGISMNSWFEPAPGQPYRQPLLADLNIQVSLDGRSAVVTPQTGQGFRIEVTDVEYFDVADQLGSNQTWSKYSFSDFIRQQDMAEQAIAAGGDLRWNAGQALGSAVQVSYSFVQTMPLTGVGAPGFRAFSAAEQQAVRDILALTASLTNLRFVEITEAGSSTGQLRFGVSRQADTKGVSWLPNQAGAGDQAGDVWMDVESMRDLTPGSEGYAALLHEIGHALGLRHPRNMDKTDAWPVQMREVDDRSALTVMSGSASSDGLFRSDWGVLDVLALRYLYGTRTQHAGDDVYRLTALDAGRQITLADDGGRDSIDASALTAGVTINLTPGLLSSVGVTAAGFSAVDNLALPTSSVIEHAVGSAWDDVLNGNTLDNTLTGGLGNDWIDGGSGTDTAAFAGRRSDYEVSTGFGKVFVMARDGSSGFDTLLNIERLQFSDQALALATQALGADVKASVDEDTRLTLTLPDAGDAARSATRYALVGQAGHGTATVSASGAVSYQPAANFWGADTLTFEMTVGAASNRYQLYIQVNPLNDAAPVGRNGSFVAAAGVLTNGRLPLATDADGDALSYSLATDAAGGKVTVSTNGDFVYQSSGSSAGSDSFVYTVSDGMGGSSNYTASIELLAVAAQRSGTAGADNLAAAASGDAYLLQAGNDRATGGGGDDLIDGGAGLDMAVYAGNRSAYTVSKADMHWRVADRGGAEGTDRLVNMERLQFKDGNLALDLDGTAGSAAQVIRALFGGKTLKVALYAGHAIKLLDDGMAYGDLVALAISLPEFGAQMPSRGNRDFVNLVYQNVTGSAPDAGTLASLTGLLDSGAFTQVSLGVLAAQHAWNTGSTDLVGLAATGLAYTPIGG